MVAPIGDRGDRGLSALSNCADRVAGRAVFRFFRLEIVAPYSSRAVLNEATEEIAGEPHHYS